jgi:hypothetical protein
MSMLHVHISVYVHICRNARIPDCPACGGEKKKKVNNIFLSDGNLWKNAKMLLYCTYGAHCSFHVKICSVTYKADMNSRYTLERQG